MRNNDEIVAYVDNLRKSQNMSLNELARSTGLAKSSLSRYFNKTRDFPVNKVHLFAKALHTTSEDILGFEPDTSRTDSTLSDKQNKSPLNTEEEEMLVMYRKYTNGMSAQKRQRLNNSLDSLMNSAQEILKNDKNAKENKWIWVSAYTSYGLP